MYMYIIWLLLLSFIMQISYVLSKLERFFAEIEPEVEAISGEESDTQAFMKLMSIFNRVRQKNIVHYLQKMRKIKFMLVLFP